MAGGVLIGLGSMTGEKVHSKVLKTEIVTIDGWVLLSTDR